MSDKNVFAFRDEKTGELREIDLSTGVMLSYAANGDITETRMAHDDELAAELSAYAFEYDRRIQLRAWDGGRSVQMDLGIADVSDPAPLPNYMSGYRNAEPLADLVSPVVMTSKPAAKYYEWNSDDAFQAVDNTETAPGGAVAEISPRLSKKNFDTVEQALGSFVPTEVEAAADTPIQPFQASVRRVVNALRIGREGRVKGIVGNAASYAAAQKVDLSGDATKKWNGGTNSDPVKDIQTIIENALMEPTDIIMSRRAHNAFVRNPAVQKYTASKSNVKPIPTASEWSALLELPPITVGKMKRKDRTTGVVDYIWGNDVILVRRADSLPADGQDIATSYTFRWNGGATPDGNMTGGMLVRTFFDQKRGPKGGMQVVVVHQDGEVLTSSLVGGMIIGAYQ